MIIDRNISQYIVFAEDYLINALKKISDNKSRIVFSVAETGILEGILTDGDFRRWLINRSDINLNQPVSIASNKSFKFAWVDDVPEVIQSYFSDNIQFVPILDRYRRLVAIAKQQPNSIKIGQFTIDDNSPTFIIAEIGNNHNGSLNAAKKLIDVAVEAGASCAKFQMRHLPSLYRNGGNARDISEDLGSQYTLDLLSRFQLSNAEMLAAFDYCKQKNILPLCTPWDCESLNILENYGMEAYKIASADLTNHDLITALIKTGKPLICSTGMSVEVEIKETVALFKKMGAAYILLHCNSTYPTPFKDVNLNYLDKLKNIGDCPIGYSGHERGTNIIIAAVAKGAKVIEKHLTLDKSMEGNDHKVSLLPEEFKTMVLAIRQVEESLGSTTERQLTQGEIINRETLAKSLAISCDLKVGQIITEDYIEIKSPGKGLQPNRKAELIGTIAKRTFKAGDFFFPSDLQEQQIKPRYYSFKRPWGLPVRYHDFKTIIDKSNPDFVEFHLSYKDLEQDFKQYLNKVYDLDFVIHSPELFAGDLILDLCSQDKNYRQSSIQELQKIINLTRSLIPYFKKTTKPYIVTNVGGFSKDAPFSLNQKPLLYDLLLDSLDRLDTADVEIIPQTMPPFPWHFGGQSYHNLFVTSEDIEKFCSSNNYRICLDISHSQLACNYHKLSLKKFIEQVGKYVVHLHIADASGVDGEGLQIEEGDIVFSALAEDLEKVAPNALFIPEIWQGHKNEGEGFWLALERLEKYF
jgi:sialic acid synthase SpsE/sugar phosphate isomerase/epimerase